MVGGRGGARCSNEGSGADESVEEIEEVRCRGGWSDAEEHGEGEGEMGIAMLVLMLGEERRGDSEEVERTEECGI